MQGNNKVQAKDQYQTKTPRSTLKDCISQQIFHLNKDHFHLYLNDKLDYNELVHKLGNIHLWQEKEVKTAIQML